MISNLLNAIWYQSLGAILGRAGFQHVLVAEASTGFEIRALAFKREPSDVQKALLKL